jgi:hypothetical protein
VQSRISYVTSTIRALAFTFLVFVPGRALPQTVLESGDLVVSHTLFWSYGFTDPKITAFANNGIQKVDTFGGGRDLLVSPDGVIFAIDYWTFEVSAYSASLTKLRSFGVSASALAMDRDQNLYFIDTTQVRKYSPAGAFLGSQPLPPSDGSALLSADLGIDQCTLYYFIWSDAGRTQSLRRYDLCLHRALPDLGDIPYSLSPTASVRVASDGSVFVANLDRVYRFVGDSLVQTYRFPSEFAPLAIAPTSDASRLWTIGRALILLDWQTQTTLAGPFFVAPNAAPVALAIYGVPRASAAATTVSVPVLSPAALAALVLVLAAAACLTISRGCAA